MRILLVTNKRYPNPRGSSGGLDNLREELIRRGHTVFVLASTLGQESSFEDTVFRYKVYEVWGRRWVWNPVRIAGQLKELRPDVVHTQQYDGLGRVARRWTLKNGVPWVQTISDVISVKKAERVREVPAEVIASAKGIVEMIAGKGGPYEKATIVPTGISEEKFMGGDGSLVRREWSIPSHARILLSVSRLAEEKNTEFLFRALLPLVRSKRDIYLLCVGGGNLLDSIRDAIVAEGLSRRVLFSDEVPQERMKHYFSAADIFVYASKEDFRATVVTEAMYFGLPVVAVRSGGTQDRVMDKVTGLLVAEREDVFMEAVQNLLKDPQKAEAFGRSGRAIVQEQYTNVKSVDMLIGVYERARRGSI